MPVQDELTVMESAGNDPDFPVTLKLGKTRYELASGYKVEEKCTPLGHCETYYSYTQSGDPVFESTTATINRTDEGYRWENIYGDFKLYDGDTLKAIEMGDRTGPLAFYVYDNGDLAGIEDRNGARVLWIDKTSTAATVSDKAGREVTYTLSDGLITEVTDVLGYATRFEYTAKGGRDLLTKVIDPEGHTTRIGYTSQGLVKSVLDDNEDGYYFEFDYDNTEKLAYAMVQSTDGTVRETWYEVAIIDWIEVDASSDETVRIVYWYPPTRDLESRTRKVTVNGETDLEVDLQDDTGRTLVITDAAGNETRKEYNEWDQLTRVVYPDGTSETRAYDSTIHKLVQKTDENGVVTTYEYDDNANRVKKTEAAGTSEERITTYAYEGTDLVQITRGDHVTSMDYDTDGNRIAVTDPEGNTTAFTHDIMGNVLTRTDGEGNTFTYAYDAGGNLLTATDPVGNTTAYTYDKKGRKTKQIAPDGLVTEFEYDARDHLVKRILIPDPADPSQNIEYRYDYTFDGNLIEQTDPEGNETVYDYDEKDRLVSTTDPAGNEIVMAYGSGSTCSSCQSAGDKPSRIIYPAFERTFTYASRGRKITETDIGAETRSAEFAYDPAGNLVARTDRNGRTTYYDYDVLGRLVRVTDPAGGVTAYTYDQYDNLTALTDAEDSTTQFEYDGNNRLTRETRPMGETFLYTYDAAGNLAAKTDAEDQTTQYFYDAAGRLIRTEYYDEGGSLVKTVTFTYDTAGRLTGYDDGTTSAVYTYDLLGRKTSETVDFGPFSKTITYTYTKTGRKETFTSPAGITYGYLYDAAGQLSAVQIPDRGYITVNSYTWNRPDEVTLPNGGTKAYTYDPFMRMETLTATASGGSTIMEYAYTRDAEDNITRRTTEHGDYTYAYDDLYRLTDADNPDIPELTDEAYTYDSVGNRLTSADTTTTWSYNQNNELEAYNNTTCTYDANGNMIKKSVDSTVTTYVYNTEDRLTQVWDGEPDTGSLTASYYYDPFGRRLWKDVNGTRTYFMYADEGLVAEINNTGTITRSYGWQPGSTWGTDPLFMAEDTDSDGNVDYYFYHNDHLGTPHKMTSVSGAVVWSAKYQAFGRAKVDPESTITNNLRFPGQYYDEETGLHYNWWRYYEPGTGRYLRADPIGIDGGINLYSYTANNPLHLIDPRGLVCGSWWNDWLVSDKPNGYDFSACCQKHDDCYGKECKKSKKECDEEFYQCMKRVCDLEHLSYRKCYQEASKYWSAVDRWGDDAFKNARKGKPCCQGK